MVVRRKHAFLAFLHKIHTGSELDGFFFVCAIVGSPFSIAITSLREERANLSAFRTFLPFALIWFCPCPLPLGVWEGLRLVAFPGLFSYLLFSYVACFFFFFFFFVIV